MDTKEKKLIFLAEEIDILLQKVKDGNLDVAISVVSIEGGHRVTINSEIFDVMDGTDANVTAENIAKALGYVPAKNDDIPKSLSDLNNDTGYIDKETDPTVPDWAKTPEKPIYTASEVGAELAGTASSAVTEHNTATDAHNDIRLWLSNVETWVKNLLDADDETLNQTSEMIQYMKDNRELIEQVTTGKVSVTDIIDDLTTNVANKPLSAAQGVALKALIDALQTAVNSKAASTDLTNHTGNSTAHITAAERTAWNKNTTDIESLSDEIADQQKLIETKQPSGNYALKEEIPSVEGLASEIYVNEEVGKVKTEVSQQQVLNAEGDTVEEALAWLKENGDPNKIYYLPNNHIARYKYVEKLVGGYTNKIDISSSDFKTGQRYNASGAITSSSIEKNDCFVSDMFDIEAGDKVYIKGVRASTSTTATAPVFVMARLGADGNAVSTATGNANCMYLGQPLGASVTAAQQAWNAVETDDNGVIEWTFAINNAGGQMGNGVSKTRIAGVATNGIENVIVTVNEPIVEPTIQRVYAWVDTGYNAIGDDYENRIVELEENTTEIDVKLFELEEQLNNIKIGATEEVRWFALGDSITEGYASSLNEDGTYKQFITESANRWVNILAEKNGYTLTNHGIGGTGYLQTKETTMNARQLADTLDFSQCDMVTLAYGVNDWKYAVNIGSMADDIATGGSMVANMRYVIKKILADNPYCKIFVITPINCRSYGTYATNWGIGYKGGTTGALNGLGLQDIFDRMKEVCDYHGIEMIDMTHSSIVNRDNIQTMLADYVHPTIECHKAMARELAKKINFK